MNEIIKQELIKNGASDVFLTKVESYYKRLTGEGRGLNGDEYKQYREFCERLVNWIMKK